MKPYTMLTEYFLEHHVFDIENILNAPEDQTYHAIYINFVSLFEADPVNAQKILHYPRHYLPLCDDAAIKAQERIVKPHQYVKRRVRIRITAVPVTIDHGQIGELVSVSGITVRTSQPSVLKVVKRISCKMCHHLTFIKLEWERLIFPNVKECSACHASDVTMLNSLDKEDCSDYQEIKIQEKFKADTSDSYTTGLQVMLLDDLVDKCRPGDSVDISGVVIRRWGPLASGRRMEATTIMLANSVLVRRKVSDSIYSTVEMESIFENYWKQHSDALLVGRDNILASISPQLHGMYTVKLSVAVILAGGVSKTNNTGTRLRGEPHLLLIGDPGTGKSQLLRAASRLAARSIFTTGIGTTAAGLTAAAVKDSDGWHLEAGALVLADGGVCCVDEFTTMSSHDRASVHEAMEQQTISIAKAGMVSTLNSRCTVIAAINPEGGRFGNGEEWKTRLGLPLLSRFDLILLLRDSNNAEWDEQTCDHILRSACDPNESALQTDSAKHMDLLKLEGLWKEESLREYLAHIHTLKPILSNEAKSILSATYLYHRSNSERRVERTTVRLLDSLIRLAEGHARLMYRSEVQVMDAVIAAELIGTTKSTEMNSGCPFPKDPMAEYRKKGKELLSILGLEDLEQFL